MGSALAMRQPRRIIDVFKAEREFWFKDKTDFEDGLPKTLEWYIR